MKGGEKGRKCGAVDKWITGRGADAGRSQGNKRVKQQFREGNLLRVADVRGNVWASACWFRSAFIHADHLRRVPLTHITCFMLCDVEQRFTNQDEIIRSPFGSFTP